MAVSATRLVVDKTLVDLRFLDAITWRVAGRATDRLCA